MLTLRRELSSTSREFLSPILYHSLTELFKNFMPYCRFDRNNTGLLSAEDFRSMWREASQREAAKKKEEEELLPSFQQSDQLFEAGIVFSKFGDENGMMDKESFERLIREYPQILAAKRASSSSPSSSSPSPFIPAAQPPLPPAEASSVPTEIITGLFLTHYDETAGVPITRSAAEHHKRMGNVVIPLTESYKTRYDKLRHQLTGKLLPRREHLLQLRRQLHNSSVEVSAVRRNIERETQLDAEQILDRLRSAESLRQSAIKHQVSLYPFRTYYTVCIVIIAFSVIDSESGRGAGEH